MIICFYQLYSQQYSTLCQLLILQIKATEVQKNLKEDEVAIEFVRFNLFTKKWTDSIIYAAYILNKNDSTPVFVPLCEEKQLQKLFDSAGTTATVMVSQFYRGLEVKNKNTAGALGTELYKLIWQPLEPYLKNVKKVSYSPAGKLYSIAFHALPADGNICILHCVASQMFYVLSVTLFLAGKYNVCLPSVQDNHPVANTIIILYRCVIERYRD